MRLVLPTAMRSVIFLSVGPPIAVVNLHPVVWGRGSSSAVNLALFLTRVDAVFSTVVGFDVAVSICLDLGERPIYLRVPLKLRSWHLKKSAESPKQYGTALRCPPFGGAELQSGGAISTPKIEACQGPADFRS